MTRDDPSAFAPPPSFGPFRVLHQIGVGALGPVFRTYEPTRDRLVAVKVFRLDITPEQAQALADEMSRATDAGLFHPSIVEPIAAGVEGTVAYRAEEYVAGESMDAAIRHYAPAALDKALPFLTQLAGAIDFARAAGVGHGALHLRDIFVTPDEARASGFGVVDALERVGLRAPVRRPYSAPERIAGEPWSTPADVFSLAAIAYELLTGRRPAGTGDAIGALTGDTLGEQAAAIRAVLARAMDDDPARRYPSALGFASALEAAARGQHVTDALRDVSAISRVVPVTAAIVDEPEETPDEMAAGYAVVPAAVDAEIFEEDAAFEREGFEVEAATPDLEIEEPPLEPAEADYELHSDEDAGVDEPEPATLFDDEAAEKLEVETPAATERFAEEFAVAATPEPIEAPEPRRLGAQAHDDHEYDREPDVLTQPEQERARPAMLPLAMTAILCLLIGFFAGRFSTSGREVPLPAAPEAATGAATATPPQPVTEFSEQAVVPPSPTGGAAAGASARPAQPASPAPDAPGDEPAATTPPARPAPAKPAATSGSIDVRSTPSRAQVTVNGKWSGRTPLRLPMKFGTYTVRVVQPGYVTAREEVTLSAGDPTRTLLFRLQAAPAAATRPRPSTPATRPAPERSTTFTGSIYVDSRPRGATILIDGKASGTTPARIPEVAIGSHVVRLELADHRSWSTSTRVTAGEEARVSGSLERIR